MDEYECFINLMNNERIEILSHAKQGLVTSVRGCRDRAPRCRRHLNDTEE